MASLNLRAPAAFNFSKPEEWRKWKTRFEQFRLASGLSAESEERQVSSLMYCMGEDAEEVLATTNITAEQKKEYRQVVQKFDEYFKVRKNLVYKRASFNLAHQVADESAEQFITRFHQLAENCEFGDLKNEMIRDRLVIGIRDGQLSERLQMESDLTLQKAEKLVRQRAAVSQQQQALKTPVENKPQLESIKQQRRAIKTRQPRLPPPQKRSAPSQPRAHAEIPKCRRCGKSSHPRQHCPARDAICHRCKRQGHYATQCLSKTVAQVTSEMQELTTTDLTDHTDELLYSDVVYLNTVGDDTTFHKNATTTWNVQVTINKMVLLFKVDTGAEATAMSESAWKQLNSDKKFQLASTTQQLCGPDQKPLDVLGTVTLTLTVKSKSCIQKVFVVRNLRNNLLGLPAIKHLQMLPQLDTIQKVIPDQFPGLFTGLGTMKEMYTIKMKPNAKPYALYTPRNVPLPLRAKVQTELKRMENMGVISKVETSTPWCAGMVVVPKQSGEVRICVDLKPLNESVLREVHPLPKVETTLSQLSGAKVFSKIDTNSGFWQIPLDPQSRLLTTFLTPFGRFCFNKLPFGISSAPEHFQRRMNNILAGIPGM